MIIGVPKEIKVDEYRTGLVPASVRELVTHGHQVLVQKNLGEKIGFTDAVYANAGARIVDAAEEIYAQAEMIVKVKEPQLQECQWLRAGQIIFAYLHLAPDPMQAQLLQQSGCVAIAYETVTKEGGGLPLLAPMSEVAGYLAVQAGATSLEVQQGGKGVLLGGITGVAPATVLVLGGGVVGMHAVRLATGMGAEVIILDKSLERLAQLDLQFGAQIRTIFSTAQALEEYVPKADLVIGAALIPGASAPRLLTRDMLKTMQPGSVLVDVSIDQGGCFETSHPTTHESPRYIVDGIVHYCVSNMPSAVPRTASVALNNATLPFVLALANQGYKKALQENQHFLQGLNVCHGHITHPAVAAALGLPYTPAAEMVG